MVWGSCGACGALGLRFTWDMCALTPPRSFPGETHREGWGWGRAESSVLGAQAALKDWKKQRRCGRGNQRVRKMMVLGIHIWSKQGFAILPRIELPDCVRELFAILCYYALLFILGKTRSGFVFFFIIILNFCSHICNFVKEIMNAL